MSYANKTEAMEGIINKLRKKVRKHQDELVENNIKIEVYRNTEYEGHCENLSNRNLTIEWAIEEFENEIKLHEKALSKERVQQEQKNNGNACINPFLNKAK